MKVKHKKAHFSVTSGLHSSSRRLSHYQPPLPPFFFFGGAFLRVAPDAAGFCCRGGTTLLPPAAVEDPDPGLGEVGGLLAVLLASLEKKDGESKSAAEEATPTPAPAVTHRSDDAPPVAPWVPFPICSFFLPFFLPL